MIKTRFTICVCMISFFSCTVFASNKKDAAMDKKIQNTIAEKIDDRLKLEKLFENILRLDGKYDRYGEEIFGTPYWQKWIKLFTDEAYWHHFVKNPEDIGCDNCNVILLEGWYKKKLDIEFIGILKSDGYLDSDGFFIRRKSKIAEKNIKKYMKWLNSRI